MAAVVGFTGTQIGMTPQQQRRLRLELQSLNVLVLHHGDCHGSDQQAHDIAGELNIRRVIHPPSNDQKRAHCQVSRRDRVLPPRDYLDRNHDIVDEVDLVIAATRLDHEELRSGTWATVRYARRIGTPALIIQPDGKLRDDV